MDHDTLIWCKESIQRVLAIASLCSNEDLDKLVDMLHLGYVEADMDVDAVALRFVADAILVYRDA